MTVLSMKMNATKLGLGTEFRFRLLGNTLVADLFGPPNSVRMRYILFITQHDIQQFKCDRRILQGGNITPLELNFNFVRDSLHRKIYETERIETHEVPHASGGM